MAFLSCIILALYVEGVLVEWVACHANSIRSLWWNSLQSLRHVQKNNNTAYKMNTSLLPNGIQLRCYCRTIYAISRRFSQQFSIILRYFMHFHHVTVMRSLSYLTKHFQVVFRWTWYTIITLWKLGNNFQEVWCFNEKKGWSLTGTPNPDPHYKNSRCVQMTSSSTWHDDIINKHVVKHSEGSSLKMVYNTTRMNVCLIRKFIKHAYFWSITGILMLTKQITIFIKTCDNKIY